MSVPASEGIPTQGAGEDGIDLVHHGDGAFSALMDALVPDETAAQDAAEGGEAAPEGGAAAAEADSGAAPAAAPADGATGGTGASGAAADAGAGGAASSAGPGGEGAAAGGAEQPAASGGAGDLPATWTADAATLIPEIGKLATALEENTLKAYQTEALTEAREEHSKFFDALSKHPRLLVGQQVPAIGKDGFETLRDTADAREWQEAVKSILTEEIQDRASRKVEETRDYLDTIHSSVQLFQSNPDLIPGTKGFDRDLANKFATLAKPYEVRVEGKLQGYSIPTQPIIEQLRTQVQAERAAKPAAQAPVAAPAARVSSGKPADPPQAGITSKAGVSGDKEDFSTLFGTIGLPNFTI